MASEIETSLYGELANFVDQNGEVGDHLVMAFEFAHDMVSQTDLLRLQVAPRAKKYYERTIATFPKATLPMIVHESHDPEDVMLPWGIKGFYSSKLYDQCWSFNLNCHFVCFSWSSHWPIIQKHNT